MALTLIDEEVLVGRMKMGDLTAFDEWVSQVRSYLHGYIVRIVHNLSDAEDVLMETLERAWRKISTFKGNSKFLTWVTALARNTAFSKYRRSKTREFKEVGFEEKIHGSSEDFRFQSIDYPTLESEICRLLHKKEISDDQRECVDLYYYEGLGYSEIADRLGISIGTVKSRLFYALEKLRTIIERNPLLSD